MDLNIFKHKTLQQALKEAARPLTKTQQRIQQKYGQRWATNGKSEGCIFKKK